MELSEGYAVGPYRLVGRAGSGGMAEVWRAYDARLKRYVAIKFLSPRYATDETYLERFRHEAQAISRLDHPNILTIYDYGEQEGWTYMVSPFVGGGTLAARLRRGPWSVEESTAVLDPLASALDYAHAEGIVHRDVKPSNVLFTERDRLVLSDFGIARMVERSTLLSQAGLIVGTPMYMSPEQADGQRVSGASDLYSLGVIAYEMLTGRPPFMADTPLALLRAHIDKPLPPPRTLNPSLPEAIEGVLFTIMAKDSADRFATGRELVAALREASIVRAEYPFYYPGPPMEERQLPRTVPVHSSDLHIGDARLASAADDVDRTRRHQTIPPTIPVSQTPPVAPTLPLDPMLPTRAREATDLLSRWLAPLSVITIGWIFAWILLVILRFSSYSSYGGGLPLLPSGPQDSVPQRLIAGLFVGLIGGTGLLVGIRLAGLPLDRQRAAALVMGWSGIYGLTLALPYVVVSGDRNVDFGGIDLYLAWVRQFTPPGGHPLMHLVDVLPAALGAGLTAYVLCPDGPRPATLILGWTAAAGIALFGVMILGGMLVNGQADVLMSIRRFGLAAGVVAGVAHGLIGGWVTLASVRRMI